MQDEAPPYESPLKKRLLERLATASPKMRELFEDAVHRLDHTDPITVLKLLPPETATVYLYAAERAGALAPLMQRSHEAGCFIQSLILAHGMAIFALRGLIAVAWQRAVLPQVLTPKQLAPYYTLPTRRRELQTLVELLQENELMPTQQASELMELNTARNKAAHGVIFGEIASSELKQWSTRGAAVAATSVEWFAAWLDNPRPLRILPRAKGR